MNEAHSDALVIFGVTGDLAHKAIFPALYALVKSGALQVPVVGVASPKWSAGAIARPHGGQHQAIAAGSTTRTPCAVSTS